MIAFENNISTSSTWRILRQAGFRSVKPTTKPGLTEEMRKKRLEFCLAHQHWTIEDFKAVIFTDETSVYLNQRRGGRRVWRREDEAYDSTVIRRRYKGASDFMFWGCFTYDRKGPMHIYLPENTQQKKAAAKEIEALNLELEPLYREKWELQTSMARLKLRDGRLPGRQPVWRFTKKNGRLERSQRGGVDWYRYYTEVLKPKLLPFAKECMVERPNTIVLEDHAPAHNHHFQQYIYDLNEVQRLLDWPGNSPDLNAIEPAWFWFKRRTTSRGAPRDRKTGIQAWTKAWNELSQVTIQRWIERLPIHIAEIIRLEGGNEYQEGCQEGREWGGVRLKGKLSKRQDLGDGPLF